MGTLYVVATPIGNLGDMSPRAQRVLREAALVLAEDTRVTGHLLRHFGISTPMRACHDHNERETAGDAIARLQRGEDVALVSDAGTPLISDPGFRLVRRARAAGLPVLAVPGPSAVIAALSVAGLPSDRFTFEGFLPSSAPARRRCLEALREERRTMVFFEAPHRVAATIADMIAQFGPERAASLARELTKVHETVLAGTLAGLAAALAADPNQSRGEIVLCVGGAQAAEADRGEALRVVRILRRYLPPGQAAVAAGEITGVSRKELYSALMAGRSEDEDFT